MKPNKHQKKRLDRTIIDYAVASILLLTLASAGMIGTVCAADSSDVRSPDAQIARTTAHPNLTALGDPFVPNVSNGGYIECEHEWTDMPPDGYQRIYEDYGEIGYGKNGNWRTKESGDVSVGTGDESIESMSVSASAYTLTATEEFSGDVVRLTGAQTTNLVWNKDNFGGF